MRLVFRVTQKGIFTHKAQGHISVALPLSQLQKKMKEKDAKEKKLFGNLFTKMREMKPDIIEKIDDEVSACACLRLCIYVSEWWISICVCVCLCQNEVWS